MTSRSDSAFALRVAEVSEQFRRSLFGLPSLWVIGLLAFSRMTLSVDRRLQNDDLPDVLRTTVDSGQALLSAIASGTITAASVVFSLTLVSVQLASSQFSPRTLRNFLGDRFQQNVFGVVLGTFAFSLAILRQVRSPLSDDGTPVVPQIGIAVAGILAIVSLFALLGSINRTARGLRVTAVADDIVNETLVTIRARYPERDRPTTASAPGRLPSPVSNDAHVASAVVTAGETGWVQQIAIGALIEGIPEGSVISLEVAVGSYVTEGQVLATVSPVPEVDESMVKKLRHAYAIGDSRTLQSDVAYGVLQLEDIALRALSPGINDPNTAISIISQMGTVLIELLGRSLDEQVSDVSGRTVHRPVDLTHADYVRAALDKVRRAARDEPAVLAAMIRMLATVRDELERRRKGSSEAFAAISEEAALIVEEAQECAALAVDRGVVAELTSRLGLISDGSDRVSEPRDAP